MILVLLSEATFVDINHQPNTWEEIDAVKLYGGSTTPLPGSLWLLTGGLTALAALRRKFGQ